MNFFFFFLTPQSRFSWVSESFSQDIGRILTWKVFFHENLFIYENWCGSAPADYISLGVMLQF